MKIISNTLPGKSGSCITIFAEILEFGRWLTRPFAHFFLNMDIASETLHTTENRYGTVIKFSVKNVQKYLINLWKRK
jgi:hypothetical protein